MQITKLFLILFVNCRFLISNFISFKIFLGERMESSLLNAKGVYAIATTPFKENGEIDFNSVDKLSEYYIESGATGITILGVMGEAPKMNLEEQKIPC